MEHETTPSLHSHPSPPASPSQPQTGYRSVLASSINLVQSYRRSQLFVGDNLPNSFHESSFSSSYLSRPPHGTSESDIDDDGRTTSHASFDDRDRDLDHEGTDVLFDLSDDDEDAQVDLPSSFIPPNALGRRRLHHPSHNFRGSQSGSSQSYWARRPSGSIRLPPSSNLEAGLPTEQSPHLSSSGYNHSNANALRRTSTTESAALLSPPNHFPRYDSLSGTSSFARRYSTPRSSLRYRERLNLGSTEDSRLLAHRTSSSQLSYQSKAESHFVAGIGTSTFGQSLFNAFNVLCGVGLLSEPLAFSAMGWVGGVILFIFCGLSTNYTGKLLARLMAEDRFLLTYNDICYKAFGRSMQYPIAALFCLELFALSVALVVIFGDSLSTIFPEVSPESFKILAFCLILPTVFMPFQILSYASLLGLLSSLVLVSVVVIDGLVKEDAPGSIFHPAKTSLKPSHKWGLSAGLMMSGFSGHSVIPSIAREMRNPQEFNRMLDYAYLAAGSMYMIIGLIGYLMFGDDVSQEITQDILRTPGYPRTMNQVAIWMVGINPIAKFALCTRPLNVTIEHLLNLNTIEDLSDPHGPPAQKRSPSVPPPDLEPSKNTISNPSGQPTSPQTTRPESHQAYQEPSPTTGTTKPAIATKAIGRVISRTLVTSLVVIVSILMPNFERVMSFLGAFAAFVICTILPISAEMILTRGQGRSPTTKVINLILLLVAIVMATIGTTYSFLPKL